MNRNGVITLLLWCVLGGVFSPALAQDADSEKRRPISSIGAGGEMQSYQKRMPQGYNIPDSQRQYVIKGRKSYPTYDPSEDNPSEYIIVIKPKEEQNDQPPEDGFDRPLFGEEYNPYE